ncbi:MAG: tol-pal system YbgF family protein [Acidobacteriota bacterium]
MWAGERSKRAVRFTMVLASGILAAGCQGWDRIEPPPGAAAATSEQGTAAVPGAPPRLTNEIAVRRISQIESASGQERVTLIDRFVTDFPEAERIYQLHMLRGDAEMGLGDATVAVSSFERAVQLSGSDPLLKLPLEEGLAYRLGWARYEAGDRRAGIDWLVRSTFINDRPQLEQGLRYIYAEQDGEPAGFERWLAAERASHAVEAPDFELPGYQEGKLHLRRALGQVTLISFWSPT